MWGSSRRTPHKGELMATYPIRTTQRSLRSWFAAEPSRFVRERSPRRTIFWASIAVIGIVLTILVLLNMDAVAEMLGGRRRGRTALLGAVVLPPALVVVAIVFQFLWVHRFRVPGGGVIGSDELFIVPASLDVRDAFRAFAAGGTNPEGVIEAMRFLDLHRVDARTQTGQKIVVLSASPDDCVTFAGVLRMDAEKKGVLWIAQEPLTITDEHFFDPRKLRPTR